MRDVIIDTDATQRFDAAVDSVLDSDKALSGFILAHGQAGRGKSVAADRYYYARGGVYLRMQQGWSPTAFMQRLLFEVRAKKDAPRPRHNVHRCKDEIIERLERDKMPIFVDEADRAHIDLIEHLRDILDITGCPSILIGEEGLYGLLSERRRIWSRVVHDVEFGPINGAEVAVYGLQAAGLDIPSALCGRIAEKAEGDFRLVRNMMILLERAAKAADSLTANAGMLETVFAAHTWRRK